MDIKYAIKKMGTLNKITDMKWEETFFIGCNPELDDNDVHVFKTNFPGHIVPIIKDYEHSTWDSSSSDFDSKSYVLVRRFKKKYLNKLGFSYDTINDVYTCNNLIFTFKKKDNCYTASVIGKTISFYFIHQFIEFCNKITTLPIDITKHCFDEYFQIDHIEEIVIKKY